MEAFDSTTKLYDVVVVGAGAAGLRTAAILLQREPLLSVVILERCSAAGGRIRDVKFAEGIEVGGIGAWRIDTESKLVLELLQHHNVPMEAWAPQVRRFEARGACVNSVEELRSHICGDMSSHPELTLTNIQTETVTDFIKCTLAKSLEEDTGPQPPTRLRDLMVKSLGKNGEQFLSAISHGYKALANYNIDIMGTLPSANAGTETTRPLGGMSQIINVLESECTKGGALIRFCANVKSISRTGQPWHNSSDPTIYSITYVNARGRVLAGSDSLSADDYEDGAPTNVIMARSVVLAIPPRAITRIAQQVDTPSAPNDVLRGIVGQSMFKSCFGLPAFRAAALYDHAWWDDDAVNSGQQRLGERGTLLTSTSRLSMIMPYAGKGPNGEAALHLSYCNDDDAQYNGFWDNCIKNAVHRSGLSNTSCKAQFNRSRKLDEILYQTIREELAKAFVIPIDHIPDPINWVWHYWDDGAVHVQRPVNNSSSITREDVENWAVNGPLISYGSEGASGDRVVLVGEAFARKWAWVEGALVSATRGAETILSWITT